MYTRISYPLKGAAELITGNFTYFTQYEAKAIAKSLQRSKTLVMVYDRDNIATPANERATWIRRHFQHDQNLEVRVVYGAPTITQENAATVTTFLQKRIPNSLKISSVCCEQPYSQALAKSLKANYKPELRLAPLIELEAAVTQNEIVARQLLTDISAARVLDAFKMIVDENQFQKLIKRAKKSLKKSIYKYNQGHPNKNTFFKRTRWDTSQLNRINLPVVIGSVAAEHRSAFSDPNKFQIFDMPIYMPGQGWKIPAAFAPIMPVLAKITAAESLANPAINHCNVYLTLDSGIVFPNGYARREGLHVDGFLTNANAIPNKEGIIWSDNTYIISDASDLQTELYPGPFDLSNVDNNNVREVLQAFSEQGKDMPYQQSNAYDMVRLTTNNVHAVHPNQTDHNIQRSFLKMTFSERLFNRGGNTVNPHLNYRFTYVPRTTERNTQNFTGVLPQGYEEGSLNDIDLKSRKLPQWTASEIFETQKKPHVEITATPAIEGETLDTIVNGQVVTTNVARAGDMKITRTNGDKYFLSKENFNCLYKATNKEKTYEPTIRQLKAVKVSKNISFLANWGTRQNIPAGGVIVQAENNEKWGVHEQSFNATYLKL